MSENNTNAKLIRIDLKIKIVITLGHKLFEAIIEEKYTRVVAKQYLLLCEL
jgi:hypothetical protein